MAVPSKNIKTLRTDLKKLKLQLQSRNPKNLPKVKELKNLPKLKEMKNLPKLKNLPTLKHLPKHLLPRKWSLEEKIS